MIDGGDIASIIELTWKLYFKKNVVKLRGVYDGEVEKITGIGGD